LSDPDTYIRMHSGNAPRGEGSRGTGVSM